MEKPSGMDELTRKRLTHNEAVFRRINEEIDSVRGDDPGARTDFVCECTDPGCSERIPLTPAEYGAVRASAVRFVVVEGHQQPELEDVVGRGDGYAVVEKRAA